MLTFNLKKNHSVWNNIEEDLQEKQLSWIYSLLDNQYNNPTQEITQEIECAVNNGFFSSESPLTQQIHYL